MSFNLNEPSISSIPEIQVILDSSNDAFIAVNKDVVIILFNKSAERITGLLADNVIGQKAFKTIPDINFREILSHGKPKVNVQQRLGDTVVMVNLMPVRDDADKIIGAVVIIKDVTELKALGQKISDLWDARELLEAVIEGINDAVSVADADGKNIMINPAYTRITGLPKEAVIGKPVTRDIAEGESMHLKVLSTGKPVRNVRMSVGPTKRDVVVNVAPIIIGGKICGSVGMIHDISEIKHLTDELSKTRKLLRHLKARYTWDDIIGASPAVLNAKEQALRAAETSATVLLRGESGIGKELFAHAIHNASNRRDFQFVRVNCSAIAESLLESELFGYVAGAFTGALKGGKRGYFEEAEGGTVFLDEAGELGLSIQSKLLRVLQEREVVRVGSTDPVEVNVRIIAATNANLERKIKDGTFREDLYYRLNVIPIHMVPLRDRVEDIPLLSNFLLFRLNQNYHRSVEKISNEALGALMKYAWPGNVRELENMLGRAMLNTKPQDSVIEINHLPELGHGAPMADETVMLGKAAPLSDVVAMAEKRAIMAALVETEGNRTKAAQLLELSIRSLYYKLDKYNIKK